MITGQCLCGSVSWQAEGPFTRMNHCHCSMCRKAHGAAFASFTSSPVEGFSWTSETATIQQYTSSPDFVRAFCSGCGSAVPQLKSDGQSMRLPVGPMDLPTPLREGRHIFVGSKAPWHIMPAGAETHDACPADMDRKAVEVQPEHSGTNNTALRGSCLCGEVTFAVSPPFTVVHNCHCSRCRRARAAAHATNGFVALDAVTFHSGEGQISVYYLPDTGFGQAFCQNCGSGLPRRNESRGIVNIPLASLDDDPGRGADDHIFTGSKSDWYDIGDDLPQFTEMPG
ncbi:MAG: GFA family protein [Paracoccaceae bacterium]